MSLKGITVKGDVIIADGDDEPAEVPTVSDTTAPTEALPSELQKGSHTHDYGDTATRFDANSHVYTCAVKIDDMGNVDEADGSACGAVKYEAHSWTTDDDGVTTCSVCNAPKSTTTGTEDEATGESADACTEAGHHTWDAGVLQDYDDGNVCTADTVILYSCTVAGCDATYTKTTTPAGHSYVQTGATAPTCNQAGTVTFKCSKCGDETTKTGAPATNEHSWVVDSSTPGTCAVEANTVYKCSVYDTEKSVTGSKNPNNHGDNLTTTPAGATTHTTTCSACHWSQTVNCTFAAVTVDADGLKAAKAATCEAEGYTGDGKCSCGNTQTSTAMTTPRPLRATASTSTATACAPPAARSSP